MPILDVEIVLKPGEAIVAGLPREIADVAAEVFGGDAGSTWVKLRAIDRAHYAENGIEPGEAVYPVFVSILKSRMPEPEELRREVERLTTGIAAVCGRPSENVHIFYHPAGEGRVAFGGRVVGG